MDAALLAKRLQGHTGGLGSAVVGFDGFVDEMIKLVSERQDLQHFTPVATIAEFGAIVTRSAGHSTLREIVVTATHPGGCAINAADGLAHLGVAVDLFATLGRPAHPAFDVVTKHCRHTRSWGSQPGRTLAFEFQDGKTMFSAVTQLAELTPDFVKAELGDGFYLRQCIEAKIIVLTDWTLYPHMTAVWRCLHSEVFSQLRHRPHFFIDLVDPSARTGADIMEMLTVLPLLQTCGDVCLGLNINETNILARLLTLPECTAATSAAVARLLRDRLNIAEVVVHNVKVVASSSARGEMALDSIPHCANPMKSTGAGDRFNAGYCMGLMLGLEPLERLRVAVATSGLFVRQGHSASLSQVADFITEHWQ